MQNCCGATVRRRTKRIRFFGGRGRIPCPENRSRPSVYARLCIRSHYLGDLAGIRNPLPQKAGRDSEFYIQISYFNNLAGIRNRMVPKIEMLGSRYGSIEIIGRAESEKGLAVWRCRCDCGTEFHRTGAEIRKRGNANRCFHCFTASIPGNMRWASPKEQANNRRRAGRLPKKREA